MLFCLNFILLMLIYYQGNVLIKSTVEGLILLKPLQSRFWISQIHLISKTLCITLQRCSEHIKSCRLHSTPYTNRFWNHSHGNNITYNIVQSFSRGSSKGSFLAFEYLSNYEGRPFHATAFVWCEPERAKMAAKAPIFASVLNCFTSKQLLWRIHTTVLPL